MPVKRPNGNVPRPGRGAVAAERFCARCGARDVPLERHHWAPRASFSDADDWPTSYLCEEHHDAWHRKMGWRPRAKSREAIRLRRKRAAEALYDDVMGAVRRLVISCRQHQSIEFLWSVRDLVGFIPDYFADEARDCGIGLDWEIDRIAERAEDMRRVCIHGDDAWLHGLVTELADRAAHDGLDHFSVYDDD